MRKSFLNKLSLVWFLAGLAFHSSKIYLPLSLALAIVRAVTPFIAIIMPKYIVDSLVERTSPAHLLFLITITVGAGFMSSILTSFLEKHRDIHAFTVNSHLKLALDQKMMAVDYENLESPQIADLLFMAKETENRCGGLHVFFEQCVNIITELLSLFGYLSVLATLCFRNNTFVSTSNAIVDFFIQNSLLFILLFCVLSAVASLLNQKKMKKENDFYEGMAPISRKFAYYWNLAKNYAVGKDIRVGNLLPLLRRDRSRMVQENENRTQAFYAKSSRYDCCASLLTQTQTLLVYLFIALKVYARSISLGSFYMYTAAISKLNDTVASVLDNFFMILYSLNYYEAYRKLLQLPSTANSGRLQPTPDTDVVIEFDNVWFKYPGSQLDVLKGFSAVLQSGKKTAIVGQNGAGKTTLVYLLLRLYTPTKGKILLNGRNIQEYCLEDYIKLFSVVFQDFHLFAFDAGENVAGKEVFPSSEIDAVVKKAGVFDLLQKNNGLHTFITRLWDDSGVELSGGEAQKLAIARAIYRETPIVILDEPTSALDPISEMEIFASFKQLTQNKSAVVISHRLSSCRFCDDIWVVHNGVLFQEGCHEELVSQTDRLYYKMWQAQASLYQSE